MDKPSRVNILEVQVGWQSVLNAAAFYVATCPAGDLAEGDAEKLEGIARAVRIRLEEVKGG